MSGSKRKQGKNSILFISICFSLVGCGALFPEVWEKSILIGIYLIVFFILGLAGMYHFIKIEIKKKEEEKVLEEKLIKEDVALKPSLLTECESCKSKISTRTSVCPKCGYKKIESSNCSICNELIPQNSKSCPECGDPNPFEGKELPADPKTVLKQSSTSHNESSVHKPNKAVKTISKVVVAILVFFVGIFFWYQMTRILEGGFLFGALKGLGMLFVLWVTMIAYKKV